MLERDAKNAPQDGMKNAFRRNEVAASCHLIWLKKFEIIVLNWKNNKVIGKI